MAVSRYEIDAKGSQVLGKQSLSCQTITQELEGLKELEPVHDHLKITSAKESNIIRVEYYLDHFVHDLFHLVHALHRDDPSILHCHGHGSHLDIVK